jgi:TRAP-type C4-dicarboxylate transport system substrate-binding protein
LTETAVEAEKKAAELFEGLVKEDRPMLLKEGIKVIELPPAEREKFLKAAYDPAWADIIQKNPSVGAELKKLLTK